MVLKFMEELLEEDPGLEWKKEYQLYETIFDKWIHREGETHNIQPKELHEECLNIARAIYYVWMKSGRTRVSEQELKDMGVRIPGLAKIRFKGHALINRDADNNYKFSHKSYWEYLLAYLALHDLRFAVSDLLIQNFDKAEIFLEEMVEYYDGHQEDASPKILTGMAIYRLKKTGTDDVHTEKCFDDIIQRCAQENSREAVEIRLLCEILKTELKLRQKQYSDAFNAQKHCREALLKNFPLNDEHLKDYQYLYVQYIRTLSTYVCESKSIKERNKENGRAFIRDVFEAFDALVEKKPSNYDPLYDLLRCGEAFCHCYQDNDIKKKDVLERMRETVIQYMPGDQYAQYLLTLADVWHPVDEAVIERGSQALGDLTADELEKWKTAWEIAQANEKLTREYLRFSNTYEKTERLYWLKMYRRKSSDRRHTDICRRLLHCDFSQNNLDDFFKSCDHYKQMDMFNDELTRLQSDIGQKRSRDRKTIRRLMKVFRDDYDKDLDEKQRKLVDELIDQIDQLESQEKRKARTSERKNP